LLNWKEDTEKLLKFSDGTKLWGITNTLNDRMKIQEALDRLERSDETKINLIEIGEKQYN
jgi:hypothetical protein